jgi:hypothetical protein
MAPEQAQGQKTLTTAVDIYALGAILYEMLTGQPPFRAGTPLDTLLQIIERDPERPRTVNPAADPDLEAVCLKCLARDPQERYVSASDLATDLEHWLQGEPLSVRPLGLTSLLRLWIRHNFGAGPWLVGIGLLWGLLFGVVCWLIWIDPMELSKGQKGTVYLLGVVLLTGAGLITALLVRPRNSAADLAAGLITGLLAAVTCYTLGWGWAAVKIAFDRWGPAGLPYGIWLGMLSAVLVTGAIFAVETFTAGNLTRRHEQVRRVIGPYFELVIPATFLLVLVGGVSNRLIIEGVGRYLWVLFLIPFLGLAILATLRHWHWSLRALLHTGWLAAVCAIIAIKFGSQ